MSQFENDARMQALFDGTLAEAERAALLREINEDDALLDLYLEYARLESALCRLETSQSGLHETLGKHTESIAATPRRSSVWLAMAASVALLLGLYFAINLGSKGAFEAIATFETSPGTLLTVSHPTDSLQIEDTTLVAGSQASLAQGSLGLSFKNGVRAVVRAPAELTFASDERLFLRRGTGWFRVPEQAIGFEVITPEITVVDLGTEFGVRSRPGLPHEVHVFDGAAKVRSAEATSDFETLKAGMARSKSLAGNLENIDTDGSHFLETLPQTLPNLHWTFDDEEAVGESAGAHPAAGKRASLLVGLQAQKGIRQIEGRWGRAVLATGRNSWSRTRWPGIEGDAPRTVSHWLRVSPGDAAAQPIVGWGSHSLTPNQPNPAFLTYVRRRTDEGYAVFGVSFGAYHLDGTTPIDDETWHHFAVVYTGKSLPNGRPDIRCYLNGKPEPMVPLFRRDINPDERPEDYVVDTEIKDETSIPFTILPRRWASTGEIVIGIDELIIFEATLNETQIQDLYQYNQMTPPSSIAGVSR